MGTVNKQKKEKILKIYSKFQNPHMANFLSFSVLNTFQRSSRCLRFSSTISFKSQAKKAVIVGFHDGEEKTDATFASPQGENYCTTESNSRLIERIASSGPKLKAGQVRFLNRYDGQDDLVVMVGLGKKDQSLGSSREGHDLTREAVRTSISTAIRSLKDQGIDEVLVDGCGDEEAASEGAHLALWSYDALKAKKDSLKDLNVRPLSEEGISLWSSGLKKAEGQNLARTLMETPANYMTPTLFAQKAKSELEPIGVEVKAHDEAWIKDQEMGSFLSVSQGSAEKPVFLEMSYNNSGIESSSPVVLVGKGVTFDTGGISIMPGGKATKPGDVVVAKNGKTIQVDNTDAEGRLILADALCYADTFKPKLVIDAATLTGAMAVAIGGAASGVYSTNEKYWDLMNRASFNTGDRVWRMLLWNYYLEKMKKSATADLNNISAVPGGGSCTAAAFLKEFVTCENWMHLDIAGVMNNSGDVKYLPPGMAGRPTRTLVEFLKMVSQD